MLDAPPGASRVARSWLLRLLLCCAVACLLYWMFGKLGRPAIGLVFAAPLFGVMFARPIIDLIERSSQNLRHHALTEKRGFRTNFKGTSLHIDEWLDIDDDIDGKEHLCVSLRDLLNASLAKDKPALTTRLADITVKVEKTPYVRIEPLVKRLSGNVEGWDGSVVINDHLQRLGRHLGQQVLLPWLRKKGRKPSTDSFGSAELAEYAKPHVVPKVAAPPAAN